MPRMQPDVLAEFLAQPHVGALATLRRNGMPYTVPVWWLWEPDDGPRGAFWLTGTTNRVWCRQLEADLVGCAVVVFDKQDARHDRSDRRATGSGSTE